MLIYHGVVLRGQLMQIAPLCRLQHFFGFAAPIGNRFGMPRARLQAGALALVALQQSIPIYECENGRFTFSIASVKERWDSHELSESMRM